MPKSIPLLSLLVAFFAGVMLPLGSANAGTATIDAERLDAANGEPQNWMTHGRTYDEQRFSPLNEITADNVSTLGLAWSYDLPTSRGVEGTPLVVDGVMYATGSLSRVYALDAVDGHLLWQYDPKVQAARPYCCGTVNRGAAIWKGKLYFGTLDGRLVALDADSGRLLWEVHTFDPDEPYSITGAPRIVKGNVLIGNGGAEYGVRGYISAYDSETGKLNWRFYTVPGDPAKGFENPAMKMAAATWHGEWWKMGGGGTVWDSMAYDPTLDLLYVGVGNGGPWNQRYRSPGGGDNLFISSILALRPDTGEYVWHFQTTPGESWDFTATQHMILADIKVDGVVRKVLMQAPKNGFFYVLDRTTGALISGKPFTDINWATGLDPRTGRPIENPQARYSDKPFVMIPGPAGAHNWPPMAFNPATGLVYIPAQEVPTVFAPNPGFKFILGALNLGTGYLPMTTPTNPAELEAMRASVKGWLLAWDPVEQREVWRAQHAGSTNGGVLTTAGNLVFQGTADGYLNAYDATTGKRLWSQRTGAGVLAPPISYAVKNEQYVAVGVGWGGSIAMAGGILNKPESYPPGDHIRVYKLGGGKAEPVVHWSMPRVRRPPVSNASAEVIQAGGALFHRHCFLCHGSNAVGGGLIADLRGSAFLEPNAWQAVVRQGVAVDRGMMNFSKLLTKEDAESIRAYVVAQAWIAYGAQGETPENPGKARQ